MNAGLFVSKDIRRDVEVVVLYGLADDLTGIVFPGDGLRRVSPDERSISFFLKKASERAVDVDHGRTRRLDNGIIVIHSDIDTLAQEWSRSGLYVVVPRSDSSGMGITRFHGTFVVGVSGTIFEALVNHQEAQRIVGNHSPERWIVEINWRADRVQGMTSEI